MNTIPANDLKRHGISAIEKMLAHGPVHVIKRNQPVCVVLSEEEYRDLTHRARTVTTTPAHTVMEWFTLTPIGTSSKQELDQRLSSERKDWDAP
ncbi:MAG: hypothetical protein BWK76_05140 [Desulfobulbaceae bacterium A2]|nr:MAG: hypothetical protein BWK76_05140 [Desulfobulbaceae bacterium A2]